MSVNKKCKACKRIIVGESKFGFCQQCINKYGERLIAGGGVVLSGVIYVVGRVIKNKKN